MKPPKKLIVPIFIPQYGCQHNCVFCNQEKITSKTVQPTPGDINKTVYSHLSTWKGRGEKEIAFYGGTFTSIDIAIQEELLSCAYSFIRKGLINTVRVSTRPDAIDNKRLNILKRYGVSTVELGVQSMDDNVLRMSGRGHSSGDVMNSVRLLKQNGFKTGIQVMPGLPGDTTDTILYTAHKVISLTPDFIRIYPTIIIKDTPLEKMYLQGLYKPWSLEDMVTVCRDIMRLFERFGIAVIRVGLQPTAGLMKNIVAGPFHPSFRQLLA